jgi:DNA replication regulator SLD3
MDVGSPSTSLFARHESEFSIDSGYASSPHDSLSHSASTIQSQYLEALYSTKTSLAYFAKSALSRARSEHSIVETSLLTSLQNLILKMNDFNTKYEDFLPAIVKENVISKFLVSGEEWKHLITKFKRNCGDENEITESVLQREINELKIREYDIPFVMLI